MGEPSELSDAQCRALLARQQIGRVAVSTPDGPHVVAVSYAVVDEAVVFRTSPFSVLATYGRNARLAFEVDEVREEENAAWSAVVRARAQVLTDPDELAQLRQVWPSVPSAGGSRNVYVRLSLQELTGRTLGVPAAPDG